MQDVVNLRISRDEMMMRIAAVVSQRGTCVRASVGAVIVLDGRIVSTGYVGAPSGEPHCLDVGCLVLDDGGCVRTVHAESNAIAFAAKSGISTNRATLYCTHAPCLNCAKLILNSGIRKFYYEVPYRLTDGLDLIKRSIEVIKWV